MRTSWTRMALMAVLAITGVGAPIIATAQVQASEITLDLRLKDAPLKVAIEELIRQSGVSIIFETSDKEWPIVSLDLKGVTAEEALRYICQSGGVFFRRDENGVYIVSRVKPVEKVDLAAGGTGIPAPKAKTSMYKIAVRQADAQTILQQLRGIYVFDPGQGFREIDRFNLDRRIMNDPFMRQSGAMVHADMTPMRSFQPVPTGVPTERVTNDAANGIRLPEEAARQGLVGGGAGFGGGGLQGGGGGLQGGGGGAGQGGAGGAGGQLGAGGLIPEDIEYITFDPNDNTIVIRATEAQWRELQGYIEQFDVAPRQVSIQVQFVTTTRSSSRSLGFDWLYTRGTVAVGNAPGSFARSSDPIFLSYATGNFSTRLRTFIQNGEGRVVASPRIRTLNNQLASVTQSTITTIFLPQTFLSNGTQFTQYIAQQLPAQSSLTVRPRINTDDTIAVTLVTGIQQFGQVRTSPDGTLTVPDIAFQGIQVSARVKSGETIVLAGFTSKSDLGTQNKFPILGDLPLIGQFFRSTVTDRSTSELLIFVTPEIIED